jgi:SAM-dependent methyltransferase
VKYYYASMSTPAPLGDDQQDAVIGRLDREREQAERRYVAALAALDAAAEPPPSFLSSSSAHDGDLTRLNQIWAGGPSHSRGFLGRLLTEFGRMLPWRRRALHGAMLATINRQAEVIRALVDANRHFQSHVIWYGQTVAGFAATQRRGAGSAEGIEVVHAAINAIATDWQLRWDALQAREQRYDARTAALTKAYDELREVAALAQQSTAALKRTVEGFPTGTTGATGTTGTGTTGTTGPGNEPTPSPSSVSAKDGIPDFAYVAFEDRFRGSTDEIRRRLLDYLPLFAGASNVLDVGCGRGELLDLFRERGVSARGIDVNDEMVTVCRSRGLTAERADALAFVSSQPEASLGGLIAIQVVEHLEPGYLMRLVEAAHRALKPGAPMVLETINAACWAAFFDSYIRDFTHARPIHPDTLRYLVQASGFATADIQFKAPFAEQDRLPTLPLGAVADSAGESTQALSELVETLNAHAERLNARLFTHRDFAIIAKR